MEIIQLNVAVTFLFCFERFFYWCTVHLNNITEQTNTNLLIKILFYRFPSDYQIQHEFKKSKSEIFFLSINSIIILNSIECKCAFKRIIRLDGIKSLLLGPPHTCLLVLCFNLSDYLLMQEVQSIFDDCLCAFSSKTY